MLTGVKQSLAIRTIVRVQAQMNDPARLISEKAGNKIAAGLVPPAKLPCFMKTMP
jgi:hypothetical protein